MAETKEVKEDLNDEVWKDFLRSHWKVTIIIAAGIILAGIGGLLVFLWFKDYAQLGGLVPNTVLSDWTVGFIVTFILNIILWEFLIVGIPVIAAAFVIFFQWWNKLPEEEKEKYKSEPKKKTPRRGMSAGGGGGMVWGLGTLVWLIIVFTGNMWNTEFNVWTLDYLITSSLMAFLWVLLIGGIPLAIVVIWWLRRELKESS